MSKSFYPYLALLLSLAVLFSCGGGGSQASNGSTTSQNDTCYLLFAGDVMSHTPQVKAAFNKKTETYDYKSCFSLLKSKIQSADLAIANLETCLAGKPYRGYPTFSAPDELARDLKAVGFDVLGTSNNHSADRGLRGVVRTLDVLDKLGLEHFGSYRNKDERQKQSPLVLEVKGLNIGFLAYTYGTNGIRIPRPAVIDTISRKQIASDLHKLEDAKVDYKVIFIHWGEEYQSKANKKQKSLARWLHQKGVNAIIGSHPHVIQGSEWLRSKDHEDTFVLYSLGNFISNQNTPASTRGGLMLGLELVKFADETMKPKIKLSKLEYFFHFVNKRNKRGKFIYHLLPVKLSVSKKILSILPQNEQKDYKSFVKSCKQLKFVGEKKN